MELTPDVQAQLDAVRVSAAFAELDARVFEVSGPDAGKWLNDLVTAGIHELAVGDSCVSLLLDATGRVRSHFLVGRASEETYELVQSADQAEPVGKLLARYVLSSAVTVSDLSEGMVAFRVPSPTSVPTASWVFADAGAYVAGFPSVDLEAVRASLKAELVEAPDGFEAARIIDGTPRFPADFAETSVPAEAHWDDWMVDSTKGCFLGQESVAKIRNRGRPPFLVVGLRAEARVEAGESVLLGEAETGKITSVLTGPEGSNLVARVRWYSGELPALLTTGGAELKLPS